MFSGKLGLPNSEPELVMLFMSMLEETRADFTMSFRELSETELESVERPCPGTHWALATLSKHSKYLQFLTLYKEKLKLHGVPEEDRRSLMCKRNPRYVLRNWMAQLAIQEANNGNFIEVERLLRVLTKPFTSQEEAEKLGFASPSPKWASKLRLSCSS